MTSQSPYNKYSENNESKYTYYLPIYGDYVLAEQVKDKIENGYNNQDDK